MAGFPLSLSLPLSRLLLLLLLLVVPSLTLYSANSEVTLLTGSNFASVLNSDEIWMVEFFAPWCGHCKNLAPEWEKAAKALRNTGVNVAAVDATVDQNLAGQYGIRGYPTIKVFGVNKNSPTDYNGQRTASAIVDFGLQELSSLVKRRLSGKKGSKKEKTSDVIDLTSSNFKKLVLESNEPWLVEFFAPWCGHCKRLKPEWEKAATNLKGSVKVGAVDATIHEDLASKYGIQGFPTIKYFFQGQLTDYNGERSADAIVDWAGEMASNAPIEITQITSQGVFEEKCNRLCIISFLPDIRDSGAVGRNGYLDTIREVSKSNKRSPFNFVWVEAGSQPEFEEIFDLRFGFPAAVAVSKEKQRFTICKTAFEVKSLKSFVTGLASGRGTVSFDHIPTIKDTAPWDGKDAIIEESNEMDDILAEMMDEL